jgi:hypothetical protein
VTHHLVAGGQSLGFEMIEGGLLVEEAGVGRRDVDLVQLGHALSGSIVINALDHDAKAAHGAPPEPIIKRDTS